MKLETATKKTTVLVIEKNLKPFVICVYLLYTQKRYTFKIDGLFNYNSTNFKKTHTNLFLITYFKYSKVKLRMY